MPRSPILPALDWQSIFASGQTYDTWILDGESLDNRQEMETTRRGLVLESSVEESLNALTRPMHIIAIAEDWCGDVVRHVPVMQRLAAANPNVKVRYISRAQHPDVFARFLTNGGEAIPKFIFLNHAFVECGNWGPMPYEGRELIARGKACGDVGAARRKVSALYDADPGLSIVAAELLHLIEVASSSAP